MHPEDIAAGMPTTAQSNGLSLGRVPQRDFSQMTIRKSMNGFIVGVQDDYHAPGYYRGREHVAYTLEEAFTLIRQHLGQNETLD
jgi:hypothetical protein